MLRIQIKYLLEIYWVQGSMTKVEELLQVWGTFSASLNLQNSHKFVNQKALWASWSFTSKDQKRFRFTYKWGFMKVKEESEKVGLKLNIQKTKIMASGSITSWQIDGKQWKQWQNRLYFGGSKITEDGGCSCEIKRHLLLGRKVMTSLDSILKSRDVTLPTKVHLVKAIVFQ